MKEIGQILREAREKKGVSIDQISQQTRIRPTYLRAIEEGEFSRVPGAVYIKGFLKAFATAVDVDAAHILEMFNRNEEQHLAEDSQAVHEVKLTKPQSTVNVGKIMLICLVVGALVVVGVFVFRFWGILKNETIPQLREPEQTDTVADLTTGSQATDFTPTADTGATGTDNQPADSTAGTLDNTQSAANTQQADSAAVPVVAPVQVQPVESTPVEQTTAKTQVEIIAIQTAWIRIIVDGEEVFADLMYAGDTKTYAGDKVHLRIGNAAGIQVRYKGELLGPFGGEGKIAERAFGG